MNKDNCIFCKIANKEVSAKIIFENNMVVAFDDLRPQAPVHILIIPKDHIEKTSDLAGKDAGLVGELVLAARSLAAQRGVSESGYRLVLNCNKDAGQEVFHLHLHLLGGRKFAWPPG